MRNVGNSKEKTWTGGLHPHSTLDRANLEYICRRYVTWIPLTVRPLAPL